MFLQIVPVIDLMHGLVVRGIAGERDRYRPIDSCIAVSAAPGVVAQAFVEQFGFTEAYIADLDAIGRRPFSRQACAAVAEAGLRLLLDAGVGDVSAAREVLAACGCFGSRVRLVIGLETLESFAALRQIIEHLGAERVVFSLDLKGGKPLSGNAQCRGMAAGAIAGEAIAAGVEEMIVLDLASVGVDGGISTLALCREIADSHSPVKLITGGGVRGVADLQAISAAGCTGALVASALHNGSIAPRDIAALSNSRA